LVYSGNIIDTDWVNTNLMIDDSLLWEEALLVNLAIEDGTPNDLIIKKAKEVFGLTWWNIEWDSAAINIVESNTTIDLVPIQYDHCDLDGTLIAHGYSINTYIGATVSFDSTCEPVSRLCVMMEHFQNDQISKLVVWKEQ